jgi:uncharacterized protein (TIGR02147 family)
VADSMSIANTDINIFEYIDYRALLKDLYEANKAAKSFFSYRYIAQKVGFNSAGFFTNIIQHKRNISHERIFKFAALFKLKKTETEYFELLVNFDQAKNHVQKRYYFEKILAYKHSKVALVNADQYEFYSKWYYTAIRELIDIVPFKGGKTEEYKMLAQRVAPQISVAEAKKAVKFLERAGFIKKNKNGFYEQVEPFITTGQEARSVAITNFQLATMDLAKEAIDRFERDKRGISTLTFGISEEGYKAVMDRVATFNRELMEIARADKKRDRVIHINHQIFPISKV